MNNEQTQLPKTFPKFLTVAEVAALLRMKPRTIYELVARRKIPFRKPGGKLIFDTQEIELWTREATR